MPVFSGSGVVVVVVVAAVVPLITGVGVVIISLSIPFWDSVAFAVSVVVAFASLLLEMLLLLPDVDWSTGAA